MKTKKRKGHVIQTIVLGASNRRAAKTAVLSAFAQRKPDNCEFFIVGETKVIEAKRKSTPWTPNQNAPSECSRWRG